MRGRAGGDSSTSPEAASDLEARVAALEKTVARRRRLLARLDPPLGALCGTRYALCSDFRETAG